MNFLSVKEAAKLSEKSPSSVRRIIYPILEDNLHPDRHHIEPDVETAKTLRLKGENFAWKISEELLERAMAIDATKNKSEPKANSTSDANSDPIVEILRKQLDIKDQQIATQNEVIKGLSERVREGNVLMGSLQQQMAIGDGVRSSSKIVDARTSGKTTNEEGSQDQSPMKTHWLFRKIF